MAEGMASKDPRPEERERTVCCENCGGIIDVEVRGPGDEAAATRFVDVSDCTLCMDAEEGDYDD